MNCRHCREPIQRCHDHAHGSDCRGWKHSHGGSHVCYAPQIAEPEPPAAEPEPGAPSRPVHLITRGTFDLACGHDGHDRASAVAAEVTCPHCHRTPAFREVA